MSDVRPGRLGRHSYAELDRSLMQADAQLAADYPGDHGSRQPVHTVYVPASQFHGSLVPEWGAMAAELLQTHLPDAASFAEVMGTSEQSADEVRGRVLAKLSREPIEDLRIDFEDGYGVHPDAEEDALCRSAAMALDETARAATRPPYVGLRIKSLELATRRRGVGTLDLFLDSLTEVPSGFVVTLPKVTHCDQVRAFASVCGALEDAHGLPSGALRFEIQIETPQAILGADGVATVARMVRSGDGRVTGLHYGTYDYSAACGVVAGMQSLEHPVADHAKAVMQLAAAGTGVRLSDGSTNVLPVGDHDAVLAAWRLHSRLVRRSLERAYYQGWDLHPGHLVSRYAATYAFYRAGLPTAGARLRAYLENAASGVLDEPATAQALAALLVRGLHSGALDEDEVIAVAGADRTTLDTLYRRRIG